MRRILLIIILIGIWNYSSSQSSYFPLKKGMKLTYAYGKEIYGGTPYENNTVEIEILNDTKIIDGKEYFISKNTSGSMEGDKTVIKSYFRFGNDGSLISKSDENTEELVVMQKTPTVGYTSPSQGGGTSKVIDLNATIKTPIKTYTNCLIIEFNENQTITRAYYQKDIGMVATTIVSDGSEKIFIYLISE